MPKQQPPSSGDRSKIRIFFIEGEFAAGDLEHLTQVLANATRPAASLSRIALPGRASPAALPGAPSGEDQADSNDGAELDPATEEIDEPSEPKPASRPRVRTFRKPQPVDMDMSAGGKPFKEFANEKGNPASHRSRYMVAAAWLHEYPKIEPVTADHIFTCYKAADWNFDIQDPTFNFRQLKSEGLGSIKSGKFILNHLGVGKVNDMKS